MIIAPKIYKMRVAFSVAGPWDHKRIFNALREMVLASGLAFEPAKINKNWPRLAYGPALGYKEYSLGELADLYFSAPVKEADAQAALSKSAPDGVRVLRVWRVPYALPSVMNLADVMQYGVEGNFMQYAPHRAAEDFFAAKHIYVSVRSESGILVERDLKPFVLRVRQLQSDKLELLLQRCGDKTAKPEHLVAAWLGVSVPAEAEFTLEHIKFTREKLYWRDSEGNLRAFL